MKWTSRRTIMSLIAIGLGATAFSMKRRRRSNMMDWRQLLQPVRRMF
ncbi:DUF3918 family protein [Paenibacillus sp. sgz500958]